jgi:hypothetical protein
MRANSAFGAVIGLLAVAAALAPGGQSHAQTRQPQRSGLSIVVVRSERRGGLRVAVLQEPWFYCSPATGKLFAVPAGYETDFASIPPFAKLLFPQFGDWAEAAVIHDWLYDVAEPGKKAEADQTFDEAMKYGGTSAVRRLFMYWAVRLGGGGAYSRAQARNPDEWLSHFVDRTGKALKAPPFSQPTTTAWKEKFDCRQLEDLTQIELLKGEFAAQYPPTF